MQTRVHMQIDAFAPVSSGHRLLSIWLVKLNGIGFLLLMTRVGAV